MDQNDNGRDEHDSVVPKNAWMSWMSCVLDLHRAKAKANYAQLVLTDMQKIVQVMLLLARCFVSRLINVSCIMNDTIEQDAISCTNAAALDRVRISAP